MFRKARLILLAAGLAWSVRLGGEPAASRPAGAAPGARMLSDLTYAQAGERKLLLDLYLPARTDRPAPVIVWIHGGGWVAGDKRPCPAALLVPAGYAAASISYRFAQEAAFPAQIHDCKAAVRWLRASAEKYNLDPKRIGVWGASAGGHLAALLGASGDDKELEGTLGNLEHSSRVQAVCDWFGPTDFVQLLRGTDEAPRLAARLIGGSLQEKRALAVKASPTTYVSKDDPPFLIMHGDRDRVVPLAQSELLRDALKKAGVPVTLHVIKGAGHGGLGLDAGRMVREFFDKHLKGDVPASKPSPPTTMRAVK